MKVTQQHLSMMAASIDGIDTPERRERYRAGDFPRADAVKDLDKRYRWDVLWSSGIPDFLPELTAAGYSDAHLDTALRSLVKPLDS